MSDEPENEPAIERAESRGELVIPALVRAHHCRDGLVRAKAADECQECEGAFSFFAEPKAVEEFNARKSRELYNYSRPSANDRRVELAVVAALAAAIDRLKGTPGAS